MSSKLCRICLCKESLHYIFEETNNLSEKIMLISDVKVSEKDGLPQFICQKCEEKVDNFIEFKEKIKKTSAYLLSLNVKKETETIPNNNESEVEQYFDYLNNINVEVNILENIALKSEDKQSENENENENEADPPKRKRSTRKTPKSNKTSINKDTFKIKKEEKDSISLSKQSEPLDSTEIKKRNRRGKPAQCNVCGRMVQSNSRLLYHMRIHTGERPFKCNVCGKGFYDPNNLKIHSRTHTGERPFACTICPRKFAQSSNLRAHMLLHSGENAFLCDICSKGFKTKSHFKFHMRCHTNERRFPCEHCDSSFMTNFDLKEHTRIHTGEKPFECTTCGTHFRRKYHLNRHKLIHERKANENQNQGI